MIKSKFTIAVSIALTFAAIATLPFISSNTAVSSTSGAPSGKTGSPGDGGNCTGCHAGTAQTQAGLITSNIPPNGYVPGNTYTITGTITATNVTKFGFQISPQKPSGLLVGTPVITNSTETQLVGAGKYVTHKTAGTSGSGTRTWSFNWVAPSANTGAVTFYGAFNASNSNNASSGDAIKLSSLTVQEDLSASVGTDDVVKNIVHAFPSPFSEQFTIRFLDNLQNVGIKLYDLAGKLVYENTLLQVLEGNTLEVNTLNFNAGVYMLVISSPEGLIYHQKIVKTK